MLYYASSIVDAQQMLNKLSASDNVQILSICQQETETAD